MRLWWGAALCLVPLIAAAIFVLPPFLAFDPTLIDPTILRPMVRSAIVGAGATLLSGVIGVLLGWILFRFRISERAGAWLLLPFCLGSAAWAVLFLPVVRELPGIEVRDPVMVLMALIVVSALQYGPLLGFVVHQTLSRTHDARYETIASSQMNGVEMCSLVFWPELRPFFLFVAAVIFCAAFSEHEKGLLFFRASEGTDSSLVPQALLNIYRRLSNVQEFALQTTISTSVVVVTGATAALLATLGIGWIMWARFLVALGFFSSGPALLVVSRDAKGGLIAVAIGIVIVVFSACYSAWVGDGLVMLAFVPVAVAAASATFIYAIFMFSLRLSDAPLWDSRDGGRRWMFVLTLMLIRLVPGIILFFIVLTVTIGAEHEGAIVLWLSWFTAHLINNAVVIVPFMLLMLLQVRRSELEFMRASGISLLETSRLSLLQRFWKDLFIVYVFVFVLIWNGDAVNHAMSTVFTSVNAEMVTKLVGRNFEPACVVELMAPTVGLALIAVGLLVGPGLKLARRPPHKTGAQVAMPGAADWGKPR
jgi:hypothetical protein